MQFTAAIITVPRRLSGTKFQFQTATRSIRHGPETPLPPTSSSVVPNTREVHLRPTFGKFIHPCSICSPLVRTGLLPIRNSRLQQSFFVVRRQVAGPPQSGLHGIHLRQCWPRERGERPTRYRRRSLSCFTTARILGNWPRRILHIYRATVQPGGPRRREPLAPLSFRCRFFEPIAAAVGSGTIGELGSVLGRWLKGSSCV